MLSFNLHLLIELNFKSIEEGSLGEHGNFGHILFDFKSHISHVVEDITPLILDVLFYSYFELQDLFSLYLIYSVVCVHLFILFIDKC